MLEILKKNRQKCVKVNHYFIVIDESEMHVSIKRTLSIWMCNPTLQSITLMLFINAHTMEEFIQCRLWAILVYWEACMTNHADHVRLTLALISNTLRPRQNGRPFPDDNFRRIFLNKMYEFSIEISLKFVPNDPINNIPALVQIMAWQQAIIWTNDVITWTPDILP